MRHTAVIAGLALIVTGAAEAQQDLRRRIESGSDGQVTLKYASRSDVCGNMTMMRIGVYNEFGTSGWFWNRNDGFSNEPCDRQPVRALVTRADGQVVAVRVSIGADPPSEATDLGAVSASQAARFFLDLAGRVDGRVGRDALLAAVVADSADASRPLLDIASNGTLSRGLRESAASWLGRELSLGAESSGSLLQSIANLAKDPEAPQSVRSRAASALGYGGGSGTTTLIALSRSEEIPIAKAALSALSRSSDPKAREAIRRAAQDDQLPDGIRADAIRALGSRDATPADIEALRTLWPTLPTEQTRSAVLDMVAEAGGSANARWLMRIARDDEANPAYRAKAIYAAERAGVGSAELIKFYDEGPDRRVKESILDALGRIGDRAARKKLETIATNDTDPNMRKSALRRLAQNGGPEARAALESLIAR